MAGKAGAKPIHLLTAREVLAASDGDHSDGGGLVFRVASSTNTASWVFRYTAPSGKRREMGLGSVNRSTLKHAGESLAAARDSAQDARELLRKGVDPLTERDARRQAAREAEEARKADKARDHWTLARCARDYHERVIERTRTPKHAAQWISSLENHMPAGVWHKPVADISAQELLDALQKAAPHERARRSGDLGETLRRIRQRLDSVFEDAMFYGRTTTNPAQAIRRKLNESRPANDKGRFSALDFRQAPALLSLIRSTPGTAARCLEFAVLTASRTSEVLFAAWSEFDLENRVWQIPGSRMKRGEAHTVYLSDRALEIVRAQIGHDHRHVFPSMYGKPQDDGSLKPMSNMALLTVLDRLGYREQTTVHGLCRATFSTWANETGAARPDVIEACLAHSEADAVRRAYNRAQFAQERRELLTAWAHFLAKPAEAVRLVA